MSASRWLRPLPLWYQARRVAPRIDALAARLARFDARVAGHGLMQASAAAIEEWTAGLTVIGHPGSSSQRPLLIVSNHPGLVDALALLSRLEGHAVRILVADRPLFGALPALAPYLITIPETAAGRARGLRNAVRHLRSGGTLLTYPAGAIEPDPALRPAAARASLGRWSPSADGLRRLVPDLAVLPVIVSGVLEKRHRNHVLARRCSSEAARDWWAATRQVLDRRPPQIRPTLGFGRTLLMPPSRPLHGRIREEAQQLLEQAVAHGAAS